MENKAKSNQTPVAPTPATPAVINLAELTQAQLTELKKQLKTAKKARSSTRGVWVETVDTALKAMDASGFVNTTADILAKLQVAGAWDGTERDVELKKVQTRKQLLQKKPELVGKVGYKVSATGFVLTTDRVIAYLKGLDASERRVIYTAMGIA